MRAQILVAGVLFAVAGAYPVFGQALAEGALLHASSGAAGAKVGTALGDALNHATSQVGQQMHTVTTTHGAGTPQSVPHTTAAVSGASGSSAASSPSNSGGLTITSIKGGQPTTKPVQPTCAPAAANTSGSNATTAQKPCAAPVTTQPQSKSVVNLSFPQ